MIDHPTAILLIALIASAACLLLLLGALYYRWRSAPALRIRRRVKTSYRPKEGR
jgi:hypothetical protein